MAIQQLIFHRLDKSQEEGDVSLHLADAPHVLGADVESFCAAMRRAFNGKAGKNYGCFQEDYAEYPVSRWLSEFLDDKIPFLRFTHLVMEQLQQALREAPVTLEGVLLFALDQRPEGRDLFLALLPESSGFQVTAGLELQPLAYLEPARLELAARIELDTWRSAPAGDSYFTTLTGAGAKARGEVVFNALGFRRAVDTEQQTQTFLDTVERFAARLPKEEAPQVRQRVYDYCVEQDGAGEPVELESLSRLIDEQDAQAFAEFARAQEVPLADSLRPDRRKLRALVKFSGRLKGVSLSFSSDAIDRTVIYDPDSGSLIIKELPLPLRQQLNKYLQGK